MHIVKNQNFNSWLKKIELGSAQFGLDYGINNGKKVDQDQASEIHDLLYSNGSYLIDTAPAYGDSETVVSNIVKDQTRVITKLLPLSQYSPKQVINGIELSKKLFGPNLIGLIVHNASDVFDYRFVEILDYLKNINDLNIKIGVSLYDPLDVIKISNKMSIDVIQVPLSILDQRANNTEFLECIDKNNIEVHARSVFLQGLLLMNDNTPKSLDAIKPYRSAVEKAALSQGLTTYEFCLLYVFKQNFVNKIVIGLDNRYQADALINTVIKLSNIDSQYDFSILACRDVDLINPAKWQYDH